MRFRRVPADALDRPERRAGEARRSLGDGRDRRIMRSFLVAWRRRDRAELARLFAPDGHAALMLDGRPFDLDGRDAFLAFVDRAMATQAGIFDIEELDSFTGSDHLAVLLTTAGRHTCMTVYRVSDGFVTEIRAFVEPREPALSLAS